MSSKRNSLLQYLEGTLFPGITTGNGYVNTLSLIQRGLVYVDQQTDDKFPLLLIADTSEQRTPITKNQFKAELEVTLIGAVKNPDGISGNQEQLDTLIQDITKALETDRTQGNRCYMTDIKRVETDGGDAEARAALYITVVFKYASEGVTP